MTVIFQMWLGRFAIGSDRVDFTVNDGGGAQAVALTEGDYFMAGITAETQFLEHFQAQTRALGGNFATMTAVLSVSTGLITLDFDGTDTTIVWTDVALQTMLGFSGSQTGASSYVATNTARYVWLPSFGMSDYPGNAQNIWLPRSTSISGVTPNGTTFGVEGNELNSARIEYEALDESEVIKPSTGTIFKDLETYFLDVAHKTQRMRVVVDKTSYTAATDYVTAMWGAPRGGTLGSLTDSVGRNVSNFQGLWDITIPLNEYIS